ncbi:Cof subfamily of IIB subfamily of haloacid dehalogenase superfamily/HAD-superfamily hydrolase, subfamily IIB [Ruminococcus flavefaciens]|uniref:Cof subfamily of IIB subfamily of haloacid dehalogenase superfamily/HAD-superfamily hydrolase, subfamily IIB n=1 Tax=Ruminococcus flavefaciens TaxID=1265 RepID=A0A1H6JFT9_RUMFL|nr:HAD-IIB family hydrolase [Ruminococcus flavefaciens]SEH60763.1 Cof subfamily of IIB subfamily of haloacid dehalogenase superfamily/HAD-superfamily hydrolase, subfamily IIB [Ruminococcus flavefaciens]
MDKKTLYLSDLDGTLLNSMQRTSDHTNKVINELVSEGMIFSYATARSWSAASKVTRGISVSLPAIVYNGAFVVDTLSGERLISNYFDDEVKNVIKKMLESNIQPTVYSVHSGKEKFSYVADRITKGMADFVESRRGDSRNNPVVSEAELFCGDIFYLTCIDDTEKLQPFYDKYKEKYHCVFQRDIYSNEQWLEIMPFKASKSRAALQLKEYLGCERLVVFGDALNDLDLFEIADESYAVENAADELKKAATAVIESNNDDGVAKWLLRSRKMSEEKKSITELGDPRKPHGEAGAEMLKGMNEHHYAVTGWALGFFEFKENDRILDIGCGGGETLRRMSEKTASGTLTGLDYSKLSVKLSIEKNKEDIESGKMNIIEESVEKMPFDDNSFDKIITVESFYFWPDPAENLREVYRVLDKGGKFLIVADINGDADLDEKDIEGIEKFSLYNPTLKEFHDLLEKAGFKDIKIHTQSGEKWVCAEGNK